MLGWNARQYLSPPLSAMAVKGLPLASAVKPLNRLAEAAPPEDLGAEPEKLGRAEKSRPKAAA